MIPDGFYASRLAVSPNWDAELQVQDLSRALQRLPQAQREGLLSACVPDHCEQRSSSDRTYVGGIRKSQVGPDAFDSALSSVASGNLSASATAMYQPS